jgi:hypothetical protein|tara:strand:+ start:1144 stop:1341 length:198 start_codon:yes stop_codon:yes gene_type:complete
MTAQNTMLSNAIRAEMKRKFPTNAAAPPTATVDAAADAAATLPTLLAVTGTLAKAAAAAESCACD